MSDGPQNPPLLLFRQRIAFSFTLKPLEGYREEEINAIEDIRRVNTGKMIPKKYWFQKKGNCLLSEGDFFVIAGWHKSFSSVFGDDMQSPHHQRERSYRKIPLKCVMHTQCRFCYFIDVCVSLWLLINNLNITRRKSFCQCFIEVRKCQNSNCLKFKINYKKLRSF